ncbi:MAG: hypothetical protein QOJ07_2671 [Thermoleophilaceae bacterium]|jgi:hypothetical protein|nr:hypothetical protein [Thermoleophilaceae bacterium]
MTTEARPPPSRAQYARLGPDPEPLGERFDELMRRERAVAEPREAAVPRRGPARTTRGPGLH